jgi:hypothetical protein
MDGRRLADDTRPGPAKHLRQLARTEVLIGIRYLIAYLAPPVNGCPGTGRRRAALEPVLI